MRLIVVTAAAILLASGARAEPYRWASNTMSGQTFVDMPTLNRMGSKVEFWVLFLSMPTKAVPEFASVYQRAHQKGDCEARTSSDAELVTFRFGVGKIGEKDLSSNGVRPVTEGASSAVILDFVCSRKTHLGTVEITGSDEMVALKVRSQLPKQP